MKNAVKWLVATGVASGCSLRSRPRQRRRAIRYLREGRRADPVSELRQLPSADDVRADVADDIRGDAALGPGDQAARRQARDAALDRRRAARRLQERSAAVAEGDRHDCRVGRRRRAARRRSRSARPPPKFAEGWTIGKPDAIFTMTEEFKVPAEGTIPYQYIRVPTHLTEDKWIQAIEFRPSNPAVVHHIIAQRAARGRRAERRADAGPRRPRRHHAEHARRNLRSGRRAQAAGELRDHPADALHDQRRGDHRSHQHRRDLREGAAEEGAGRRDDPERGVHDSAGRRQPRGEGRARRSRRTRC